jgi:4-hydroxy 2-oxovalerate aldolase
MTYIKKENPVIFGINFIPDNIKIDCAFISNLRRFNNHVEYYVRNDISIICTSNIAPKQHVNDFIIVNYTDYINSDPVISDNSGLMLLNVLNKVGVKNIVLAGFDGFNLNMHNNYVDESLQNNVDSDYLSRMNNAMSEYLNVLTQHISLEFLTGTKYQQINRDTP